MIRDLELSILEILYNDSRTSPAQIAVMTGHSEEEVTAVIRSLEAQKIILKYPAMINWDRVDVDQVEAVIEVRVTPQRDEGFDAIAEEIYRFDEVSSVYLMSGAYDLMVTVKASSMKQLALFVAEKLSTLDHVLSTATHFVLKKYKLEGVIFEERRKDERLVVSPLITTGSCAGASRTSPLQASASSSTWSVR
ncbi:MAG: Lrp/AsnC family transcriptional regulator [Clostridia bacterium]|nr:Lrp/AsnC family transcriptional regulator [Clostridia bacterium]